MTLNQHNAATIYQNKEWKVAIEYNWDTEEVMQWAVRQFSFIMQWDDEEVLKWKDWADRVKLILN